MNAAETLKFGEKISLKIEIGHLYINILEINMLLDYLYEHFIF